ncbi:hypothetical protein STREPTOSP366_60670 [Streptomyces variabilis]
MTHPSDTGPAHVDLDLAGVQAVDAEDRAGHLGASGADQLTGLGTPNDMRTYVKNGTVEAFELRDPAKLGEPAARTAVALASGQITGQEGGTFTAGAMGECTIGKDGVINLGKPTVFNAENIDQFDF